MFSFYLNNTDNTVENNAVENNIENTEMISTSSTTNNENITENSEESLINIEENTENNEEVENVEEKSHSDTEISEQEIVDEFSYKYVDQYISDVFSDIISRNKNGVNKLMKIKNIYTGESITLKTSEESSRLYDYMKNMLNKISSTHFYDKYYVKQLVDENKYIIYGVMNYFNVLAVDYEICSFKFFYAIDMEN